MSRRGLIVALVFGMQPAFTTTVAAQQTPGVQASHPLASHVIEAAGRFGIPERWIWAVIRIESNGNVRAVSHAGAMGLMQIMPSTWTSLQNRHGLGRDAFDPRDNIMAGTAYLRALYDRYGNVSAMLAAYNAGPGRYDEHLSRGRPLPAETRAYLAKLAAITGSSDSTQLAAAPAFDPLAWHRAALFAVRSGAALAVPVDRANDVAAEQSERAPRDRRDAAMVAIMPPSAGLFVPLSGRSAP